MLVVGSEVTLVVMVSRAEGWLLFSSNEIGNSISCQVGNMGYLAAKDILSQVISLGWK